MLLTRKGKALFGTMTLAACVSILWWKSSGPTVPIYNEKPLNVLLSESSRFLSARFVLHQAVRQLKGEAVPYLLYVLKSEPTLLQRAYEDLYIGLPQSVRRHLARPDFYESRRATCVSLLGLTGSNGVIPFVARISREDASPLVRLNARSTLVRLGPGSEHETEALEALLAAMRESAVTRNEYGWLGAFSNRATEVLPVLAKGLEDPNLRDECIHSLKQFGKVAEPLLKEALARQEEVLFQGHIEASQTVESDDDALLKLKELF